MTREDAKEKLRALSFTAGMNQRYHQHLWSWYGRLDKAVRIAVGVAALIGAIASILSVPWDEYSRTSAVVSVVSLALALVLNIVPSGERESHFRELFRRWSDLREDIDSCLLRLNAKERKQANEDEIVRIRDLEAKKNRINALEQVPKKKLLEKAYKAEYQARTGRQFVAPEEASPDSKPVAA